MKHPLPNHCIMKGCHSPRISGMAVCKSCLEKILQKAFEVKIAE